MKVKTTCFAKQLHVPALIGYHQVLSNKSLRLVKLLVDKT